MARTKEPRKALDHDFEPDMKLKPFWILDVDTGQVDFVVWYSRETPDFIVDWLEMWYETHKKEIKRDKIDQLLINLDNWSSVKSSSTQFVYRMMMFSLHTWLVIKLSYYPPYHSKYNPIEHVWWVLERYRNGAILLTDEVVVSYMENMTRKGKHPIVHTNKKMYEKGIKIEKKEFKRYEAMIIRDEKLPKWFFEIHPDMVVI